MKATGIIRRIDDLGRVVMPKEIRRIMGIKEGDPLEIWVEDGAVCYKKYETEKVLGEELKTLVENFDSETPNGSMALSKLREAIQLLESE